MVGNTLKAGFLPIVFLLVLLEIAFQASLILGSLVPDMLVADFIKQQSLVILTDEILHVGVVSRQFISLLIHNISRRQFAT